MPFVYADSCLAQETLQRSKGDAKQSTLQRFAPKAVDSKQTTKSLVPGLLQRSATASAGSTSAKQKRKARRSSSDSALLLKHQQPQQEQNAAASSGLHDESEEVLPNRLVKQKSDISLCLSTPAITRTARAITDAITGTEPQHSPCIDNCTSIQTSVVGRRFRTSITCTRHTQVSLVRQPDNLRDSNAIQVVDKARQAILGYLPREIAQHLAGLLDAKLVQVTASVDEPKSVAASVPILLQVLIFVLCNFIS